MTMEEIVVSVRGEAKLKNLMGELKRLEMALNNLRKGGWHLTTYLGKRLQLMGLRMEAWGRRFEMWALSVMFFGMQVKRTFERLGRDAVNTFMKITEGQTEAGRSLSLLQGHWVALKFTIGDAIMSVLQPLIPTIIRIVRGVMEWIEQNKELVGKVILVGIVLGSLLFFIGSIILGLKGLAVVFGMAFGALGKVVVWFGKSVFLPFAKWFVGTAIPFIINGVHIMATKIYAAFSWIAAHPIILIIAALVALFIAWDYNLGGIKEKTFRFALYISRIFNTLGVFLITWFQNTIQGFIDFINVFIWGYNQIAKVLGLARLVPLEMPRAILKLRHDMVMNLYYIDKALNQTQEQFEGMAKAFGETRFIEDMFKRIGMAMGGIGEEFTAKIGMEGLAFPTMPEAPTTEITEVSIGDININLPPGTSREQAEDIVDQVVREIKRHGVK